MSRAFGNCLLKHFVVAEPEIQKPATLEDGTNNMTLLGMTIGLPKYGKMSVPEFGGWDQKTGAPDYSMVFQCARQNRKQHKVDVTRAASVETEKELIRSYEEHDDSIMDIVVGAAFIDLRNQLEISYPVNNGIVQNWEDMVHVWDYAFYNELKIDPTECNYDSTHRSAT